jgi:7,8-dihydroneopterin aldolase/epimerase/oxygenase
MSKIAIIDLEVFYCVGVTDEERAKPQRLLLSVEMDCDFSAAAMSDRLERTIDYFAVAQRLLRFGEERSWKLIEKLATNIADLILAEFRPQQVTVEVKKFSIPQARLVYVNLTKSRSGPGTLKRTA